MWGGGGVGSGSREGHHGLGVSFGKMAVAGTVDVKIVRWWDRGK